MRAMMSETIGGPESLKMMELPSKPVGKGQVRVAVHAAGVNFPDTLLLARGPVAWGKTADVLTAENLLEARRMCEAFDEGAAACVVHDAPSRAA